MRTILLAIAGAALLAQQAGAHCDGLDGPVVRAARTALERGDVRPALVWVRAGDEAEVKKAFDLALAVRKLGAEAMSLADTHFFETLVRVHRAGEGAPYTGLKPAGRDLGPAIPAVDRALSEKAVEPLLQLLTETTQQGVRERFLRAQKAAAFDPGNVDAGRAYVKEYVEFIHYAEGLYEAAAPPAGHSHDER